jgi:hypothetical protein
MYAVNLVLYIAIITGGSSPFVDPSALPDGTDPGSKDVEGYGLGAFARISGDDYWIFK